MAEIRALTTVSAGLCFTLLLRAVAGLKLTVNDSVNSGDLKQLHLLTILPYPDSESQPSYDAGYDLLAAANLAVEIINNRSDVLPGYRLNLVNGDGGCDLTSNGLLTLVREVVYAKEDINIVGIIGPGCSASAQTVSPISARLRLNNIHIAGSPLLANRTLYPYSVSMLGSAMSFTDSLFGLMRANNWNQLVALYDRSRLFFYSIVQDMETRIGVETGGMLYSFVIEDTYLPLKDIREPSEDVFPRIVVVLAGPEYTRRIMCLAYYLGMLYPTYQWVLIGRYFSDLSQVSFRGYNCSKVVMTEEAMEGNILANYQLNTTQQQYEVLPDLYSTLDEYWQQYRAKRATLYNQTGMEIPDQEPDIYAPTVYDAVWAMALALDSSGSAFHHNERNATDNIQMAIHQLDFEGVSGHVQFNISTGFSSRSIAIEQVFGGEARTVAYSEGQAINFTMSSNPDFIEDSFPESPIVVELALAVFFYFLLSVELAVTVFTHVMTVAYHKTPSIKASSIRLNQLIFVGCYLLSLGVLLYITINAFPLEDEPLGWVCHLTFAWMIPTGYVLIISVVVARMWRVYRIFIHYLNPGPFISDPVLFTFVGLSVFAYMTFALVWTVIDPIHIETVARETVEGGEGQIVELELDRICVSDSNVWNGLMLCYCSILFIAMVALALFTQNVRNPKFSTTSIRAFSYLLFLLLSVGFPTYVLLLYLYVNINIDFTVLTVVFLSTILLCIIFIVIPPIAPLLKEKTTHSLGHQRWLPFHCLI